MTRFVLAIINFSVKKKEYILDYNSLHLLPEISSFLKGIHRGTQIHRVTCTDNWFFFVKGMLPPKVAASCGNFLLTSGLNISETTNTTPREIIPHNTKSGAIKKIGFLAKMFTL